MKSKDLLSVTDITKDEILGIFELSKRLKRYLKQGDNHQYLKGKTLAMIFEKRSTRTRVSFETGFFQLGGHALFLSRDDIQLGRGETISDTAKVLSRYVDAIMIRTYSQEDVIELAKNADVPVINGLTDTFHPCQALTDFFTIYEREENLSNIKLAYIGDGNNVANSLILCGSLLGIDVSVASPIDYMPDERILKNANQLSSTSGARIEVTTDIEQAVKNANYLYTDIWVSMGLEDETKKRKDDFSQYKITLELLEKCSDNCKIMHCLPAHRGEEIESDVIDSNKSIVFDQAENRLHIQKALLCSLIK
ncbi:MAG: ornithine carbamoyltransferase [Spirochaetota bacterium]|nr:ornithine carbamoyltransferase [Spirochaetota bacterium]